MANLPLSSQADSLDSLTVTREQFRLQQSDLLEFLAQALGNVSGDYTTQAVNPTGVVLQGTPTLAVGAEPTAADDSLRLACTRWVRRNAVSAGTVAPLNPVRGQAWVDTGSDPPAIKVWDDTPGSGSWVTLGLVPDATATTKGIVQLADEAAISAGTAGRVVDAAQLKLATAVPAGRVLKVKTFTDPGSSTTSTSYANANSAYFQYTPVSATSTLLLTATFLAAISNVAGVNAESFHSIAANTASSGLGALVGSGYKLSAFSASGGLGALGMGTVRAEIQSGSTNLRYFQMAHATNTAAAYVSTQNIVFTVMEIAS